MKNGKVGNEGTVGKVETAGKAQHLNNFELFLKEGKIGKNLKSS